MASRIVEEERIRALNDRPLRSGSYVLYWMQQSQRAEHNPALEHAVRRANEIGLRLLVAFGLTDDYPEANARHYLFMLQGLADVAAKLQRRGIKFVVRRGDPPAVALELAAEAAWVVCDRGYLRHQRAWRRRVAGQAGRGVEEVEGDVVVPVETASSKREHAARTLRPRLRHHLRRFAVPLRTTPLQSPSLGIPVEGIDFSRPDAALASMRVDRSVGPVEQFFVGGTTEAKRRFRRFLSGPVARYAAHRGLPETDDVSGMSPYLHFGQISPVWLLCELRRRRRNDENARAYVEELVARRELACNHVYFTPGYDRFDSLPRWAKETLAMHAADERPKRYTRRTLEAAETHDPYWNAAMREMKTTGYMHGYMRMYWGKKIIEWSDSPERAWRTALYLNNKYFLDGRDPSSYANIGWLFGLHDRAFGERPVFGKVRWMSARSLARKCDIDTYVDKVAAAEKRANRPNAR